MSQNPEANSGPAGRAVWSAGRSVVLVKSKVEIPTGHIHHTANGERTYLVLRHMSVRHAPGTIFQVYMKGATGREALVGSINFFNLERTIDSVPGERPGSLRQFDVTDITSKLSGKLIISIRATQPPEANSEATIGQIDLIVARTSTLP